MVKNLTLLNENFLFIDSIILEKKGTTYPFFNLLKVYVSNSFKPIKWTSINFRYEEKENEVHLIFSTPVNFYFFMIQSYDLGDELSSARFVFCKQRTMDEILSHLLGSTIAFLGCARDCQNTLGHALNDIVKIGSLFKKYDIIFFENDSKDLTKKVLAHYMTLVPALSVYNYDGLDVKFPYRGQRLSWARQFLFQKARALGVDYVCVLDLDGVASHATLLQGFLSNFKFGDVWDAVFPINTKKYYDIWTIRHTNICTGDYIVQTNALPAIFGENNIKNEGFRRIQDFDYRGLKGWLEVDSAFGGMGLYKTSSFQNCNYFGIVDNAEICEHVVFHEMAREDGRKLYLNPEFVVDGYFS